MDKFGRLFGKKNPLEWMLVGLLMTGQVSAQSVDTLAPARKPRLQSLSEPVTPTVREPLSIKGYKTYSGTKILFIRTPGLPMFDIHVSFAAGSAHTADQPGLAALTFSLMNEGVAGKDLNAVMETFEGLGATLGMDISRDRAGFSLRSLSDDARRVPALELFAQVLGKPLLAEGSLPGARSQLLHFLELEGQSYATQANKALDGLLFPGHGYAQSVYGTAKDLASITRAEVQAFHGKAYANGNALITLVGDLSEDEAKRIGSQIANALPQGPAMSAINTPPSPVAAANPLRIERPSTQAHLRLAQTSVLRANPDYPALRIAGQIFTARLTKELREYRGLTYGVHADISARQAQGAWIIELQTRPELADAVLALTKEMFRDYLAHGPTEQELENVQLRLTGSAPLNSASNTQILRKLYDINLNNLPLDLDFYAQQAQRLDLAAVKDALNRHFSAGQWSAVILGPKIDQQPLPDPVESATNASCRASDEIVAS